jgi:hypothetical protein
LPELLRHVQALAEAIGPRGATAPGEARAAQYIATAAKGYTHQVWTEPFRSFTSLLWPRLLILTLAFAGGLMIGLRAGVAVLLTLLSAGFLLAQANRWGQLGWLFPRRGSQNVIAIIPAVESLRARVVLVSHYDTGKAVAGLESVGYSWYRRAFLALTAGVLLLPALALLQFGFPSALWTWLSLPSLAAVGAAGCGLIYGEAAGQYRPGIRDNAAGVAAALRAGELMAGAPLQHTEVWTVFTGCKELGQAGMHACLDRHGELLTDAFFIVLDGVGYGPVAYSLGEGGLQFIRSDQQLLDLARQVSAEHPAWGIGGMFRAPAYTDAFAALARGFAAMALRSAQAADLDPERLEAAAQFAVAITREIDRRAGAPEEA